MKFVRISIIGCMMILVVMLCGCQSGDKDVNTYDDNNSSSETEQKDEQTELPAEEAESYVPDAGEHILYQDDKECYILKEDEIENVDIQEGESPETQAYIYKVNADGSGKKMIFKAPDLNWFFKFDVATEDVIYLDISVGYVGSEEFPLGIGKIARKTDELSIITNQLNVNDNPAAYGLEVFDGKGYFFLFGSSAENEDITGIYELDIETSEMERVGALPDNFTADYFKGDITEIKNDLIYFNWDDWNELAGKYVMDMKTGTVEKISDQVYNN